MAMDLVAVIEHKMTAREVLTIPSLITASIALRKQYEERHPGSKLKLTNWPGPHEMTADNLEQIWEAEADGENFQGEGMNYYSEIDSFFGEITVNRHTINVTPFPEHKYKNLRDTGNLEYILTLNRQLAKLFDVKRILYTVDGYYKPAILAEQSRLGWSLDAIIEYGNETFGVPPKEMNEAVANLYFIDDFDLETSELDPNKKVQSRWGNE